jgi:membrane protein required for colicin V production
MSLDLFFILIFCWAAFRGFTKGFVYQLATIAALLSGIAGAVLFSDYVSSIIQNKSGVTGQYLPVISFALTFIVVVLLVHILARIIEKLIDMVALGFMNRFIGAVFCMAKYALVISALLYVFNSVNEKKQWLSHQTIAASKLYTPLSGIVPGIFPRLDMQPPKKVIEDIKQELQV